MTTAKERKLFIEFCNGTGVRDLAEQWNVSVNYVEDVIRGWRMKLTARGYRYVKATAKKRTQEATA